ncbi:hypothetical protein [Gordonia sp. KTR9]|uniref:hypothetical protein n=1 Tax=Gordonia sp. KTR9 TaxID=337191 RepID=UPI0002F6EF94|nr:hypothetical protein [Gordonia sp. KTR9]
MIGTGPRPLELPTERLVAGELPVRGSVAYTVVDSRTAVAVLADGYAGAVVTTVVPLADAPAMLASSLSGDNKELKILVGPG